VRPPTLTIVAAISALWACSSASTQAAKPPVAAPANEVVILDYKFKPVTMTVAVGTTVTWFNQDIAPHTATHRSFGDEAFDSGSLGHLKTYVHTFGTAGRYDYICIFHQGMAGTIVVQ